MRIVNIITAAAIALGSSTAAFAATPVAPITLTAYDLSQAAQFRGDDLQSAEVLTVSSKKQRKAHRRADHRNNRRAARHHDHRARRAYRHDRHYRHNNSRHSGHNDTAKVLGILGAVAIISNSY